MPFAANHTTLVESLDARLPQTQCTRCGYPNCRAYAEAVANREADIDQCPPGGEATLGALAEILGVATKPLNPAHGRHEPRRRAVIDEARCIGCRKCLDACPVDAIVGAHQWMHTVIAAQCSGCALCLPPCPVDCIALVPMDAAVGLEDPWPDYTLAEARAWRARTQARLARLRPKDRHLQRRHRTGDDTRLRDAPSAQEMRREIAAAVERVKRRRATTRKPAADK